MSTLPVGACGVTTDGRTAWQSAAGGAGQTVCNDVNYYGAEILASSQPGLAPAGHVYYGSPGGAAYRPQPQTGRGPPAYGGLATAFQGQLGFDTANGMESRASWGDHAPNYQGQQTQGVGSYGSQPTPPPRGGYRSRHRGQRNVLPRDVCSRCLGRGHWRAQCPVAGAVPNSNLPDASFVQGVAGSHPRSETYIDIVTKGKKDAGFVRHC